MQSRYYDPVTGRFLNIDAYVSTGKGLLGYNMITYCNNNPIRYIDTNGYVGLEPDDLVENEMDEEGSGDVAPPAVSGSSILGGSKVSESKRSTHEKHYLSGGATPSNSNYLNYSSGRTTPRHISEQVAMLTVQSSPSNGRTIMKSLSDPNIPSGTVKMAYHFNTFRGHVEIHYLWYIDRDEYFDFKYKD